MAESDGEDRTEEPTGKRLSEAREKGQVPRSKELTTFMSLIFSALGFLMLGGHFMQGLTDILRSGLTLDRSLIFDVTRFPAVFLHVVEQALIVFAPFFALMVLAGIVGSIALSGWNVSMEALTPNLGKLDPIKGMGKIFNWQGLVEVGKGLLKFTIVAGVAAIYLSGKATAFLGLGHEPLTQGLAHLGDMFSWSFLAIAMPLLLVVAIDVPFQLWNHKRQLKMTKQEIKEEHKQMENPEIKSRQRKLQFEATMRRMMADVPKADVVVTNPTHYAVALRYDQEGMDAPVVVAKGADLIAAQIRSIASEHDVPLLSTPPLARALYHNAEINDPIPVGLYRAVAQVLAYVYHLRQGPIYDHQGGMELPDLEIPEELRRDN